MSLTLLQSYSSAEEEEGQEERDHHYNFSDDDDDTDNDGDNGGAASSRLPSSYNPVAAPKSSAGSALPSALDAFSEIAGPPEFLNNAVVDKSSVRDDIEQHHRGRRRSRDKRDLPAGAVVEAKANLVGIQERVRSDVEGKTASLSSTSTAVNDSQPRMCLQCGVPKIYSSARGTICPVCSDQDDGKKKGSTVKDKEKNKRMKGQSSHATWKSETEMHLRQQFD